MTVKVTLASINARPTDVVDCRRCKTSFQAWRVCFYGRDPANVACPLRGCLGDKNDLVFREVKNASHLSPKHFSVLKSAAPPRTQHLP